MQFFISFTVTLLYILPGNVCWYSNVYIDVDFFWVCKKIKNLISVYDDTWKFLLFF